MTGIYTGAMGIMSYMNKLDVIANNMANAQTVGYKSDNATFRVFEETHMIARSGENKQVIGDYQHMVHVDDIRTQFDSGAYQTTDNPLELAITDSPETNSNNFFVVHKNGEDYLTRNGQFTLDEDRRLSTWGGELVLGQDGNPVVLPEGEDYSVGQNGEIRTVGGNELVGTIQMASVNDENLVFLQKEKGSLFSVMNIQDMENRFGSLESMLQEFDSNTTYQKMFGSRDVLEGIMQTGEINVLEPGDGLIQSSMLEASNVELSDELIALMEAQRGVQSSQKVWQTMSEILEFESQRIGG